MDARNQGRTYYRSLGAQVAKLRKEHGMTQAELARALGLSQQTVFAYELGDRRVSVLLLIRLSQIFRVPAEHLMGTSKMPRPVKRRLSPAGIRQAERFQQLSKTQQRFVVRIMDVLLGQNINRNDH